MANQNIQQINIYNANILPYSNSAYSAIQSGWISNHGIYIEKSTNLLKQIMNVPYCILMSNGTCATHCLFLSIKFKYPYIHKIYVPNNAYVAAYNTALMSYDITQLEVMKMDIDTWNINTDTEYIQSLDSNSAVLIVHNLGNIINVPRLKQIRPDLIFIEDNCEGFSGKYNGMYSGISQDVLCSSISFYGNKIITTGEGGAFFTNDPDVYHYIQKVYSQGMSSIKYLHELHAFNYRMTNIQAAFLYDQLNDFENIIQNKKLIFNHYQNFLDKFIQWGLVKLFKKEENTENACWIFAIRIIGNNKSIDETMSFFNRGSIDIRPFFYPIHKHTHLTDFIRNDSVSELLNKEIIMIPSSPTISIQEQKHVIDYVMQFIFFMKDIKVIDIHSQNIHLLNDFITKIHSPFFRYFNHRTSDVIIHHKITLLFYDIQQDSYFGYTHIDYDIESNKHWLGIYIDEKYRRQHLGSLFLEYTLHRLDKTNIPELYLSVDSENHSAISLYKNFDFVPIEPSSSSVSNHIYMKKTFLPNLF